jgi:hypothetical protein
MSLAAQSQTPGRVPARSVCPATAEVGPQTALPSIQWRERVPVICPTSQAKRSAANWHDGQITRVGAYQNTRSQEPGHEPVIQCGRCMSALARIPDSNPTSPGVRKVPRGDIGWDAGYLFNKFVSAEWLSCGREAEPFQRYREVPAACQKSSTMC